MSPISNASKLADFGSGIGTAGAVLQVDNVNKRIGIGTTNPQSVFQVGTGVSFYGDVGIVSCTEVRGNTFYGDGSNLTGLATTETVRADTLTVAGVSTLTGVTNVTGTANFASAVNVDATTDSTSTTTGALIVDGGVGIAKNVYIGAGLSVAGTLTYEDVTNVDSVGVVTAKSGVNITGGQLQVGVAYSVGAAGVATATGFVATSSPTININDGATEKGYIGFNGNDPFIGRKDGVGLSFQNNKVRPVDGDDGSPSNNTVDIGEPTYKFKDLHLAGNANIAGAASTFSGNLNVGSAVTVYGSSGIVSATSYYGDGSNLEGVSASGGGAIDITSCLFI